MFNFNWLSQVPEPWARFIVICAFLVPLVFALTLKKSYIYQGAEDQAWWKNLKIWVTFIVAVQIAIYIYF